MQVRAHRPLPVGFAGIVFGMRGPTTFNGVLFLPSKGQKGGVLADTAYLDLSGFRGGQPIVWRHVPVAPALKEGESSTGSAWHKLRLDVTGRFADVYLDGELKVSHEFPSARTAQGSLGLISGRGSAQYRNVRYLARTARDPGAKLERSVRMEAFEGEETSVGGSWLGKTPPFPKVTKWLQEERTSWGEAGPVPQLLVMWSIRQNDLIPINDWLAWLEEKHSGVGLRVVSVCSIEDQGRLESYLDRRPLPGAVALDGAEAELGDTFEAYSIGLFNLPRLILLDIDQKVVWEGDPGFRSGQRWSPGAPSFLDAPLAEIVEGRDLGRLSAWRKDWESIAVPALRDADFLKAKRVLEAATEFESNGDPDVFEARSRLEAVRTAIGSPGATTASFAREGAEPALMVLLGWGKSLGIEPKVRDYKALVKAAKGDALDEWEDTVKFLDLHKRRVKLNGEEAALEELRAGLAERSGAFPAMVLELLEGLSADEVADSLEEISDRVPELWLAREYFNWK